MNQNLTINKVLHMLPHEERQALQKLGARVSWYTIVQQIVPAPNQGDGSVYVDDTESLRCQQI